MSAGRHNRPKLADELAPNVVPLIDVMFLLLLFFMLGADMSQRESVELVLPEARALPPDSLTPARRTLTTNIHHDALGEGCVLHENGGLCHDASHWRCSILGLDFPRVELAHELALAAQDDPEPPDAAHPGRVLSATHLLIRADERAPYGEIQELLTHAARAGLVKVELAANLPVPGK